jgi:hypothetical protein
MSIPSLLALSERWAAAAPAERTNAQSYVIELCRALDVEPPRPAGLGYEFEFPVKVVARDGTETTNFVDCYKARFFALEAKDQEAGAADDRLLRRAFGQLRSYVGHLPDERPPYLLVLDVGKTLLVWDHWSGDYGGFGAGRRVDLRTLADRPDDVALLRDIWTEPGAGDRGEAVGAGDRGAHALDRVPPVLEAAPTRGVPGADPGGHRDDRVPGRGAGVGFHPARPGARPAGPDAADRASGDGGAGAGSDGEAGVHGVRESAEGGVAAGGFYCGESAVFRERPTAGGFGRRLRRCVTRDIPGSIRERRPCDVLVGEISWRHQLGCDEGWTYHDEFSDSET